VRLLAARSLSCWSRTDHKGPDILAQSTGYLDRKRYLTVGDDRLAVGNVRSLRCSRPERPARLSERMQHDQGDVQLFGWIPLPWRSMTFYDVKFWTLSTNGGGRDSTRHQHQPCRLAWVRAYFLLSRNLTVWLI